MLKRRKGEIATLLTLGLVLVGALITLGTSLFISNKKTNLASNSRAADASCNGTGYTCRADHCLTNETEDNSKQCSSFTTPQCCHVSLPTSNSTPTPTVPPPAGSKCGSGGIYDCPADPISKRCTTPGYEFGCCVNDNPNNMCSGGVRWRWYGCTGQPCENTKINNTGIGGDGVLHACPDDYTTDKCYGGGSTTLPTGIPEITPVCFKGSCLQGSKKTGVMYYYDTKYYKDNSNNNHCSGTSFTSELDVCKTSPAIVPSDTPANEEASIPSSLPQVGGNNQECINRFQTPYAYCGNYFGSTFSCTKTDNIGGKILKYIKYNHVCGIGALNKDLFCCVREDANSAPGTGNQNLPTPVTGDTGNEICKDILKTDKTYCQFWSGCFKQEAVGGKAVNYIQTTARCDHDTLDRYCCIREDILCTTCHTIPVTTTFTTISAKTDEGETVECGAMIQGSQYCYKK